VSANPIKQINERKCNILDSRKEVLTPNDDGMLYKPSFVSNSTSWQEYIISSAAIMKSTAKLKKNGGKAINSVIATKAHNGAEK